MSSFIVENKTINRIVNFCFWEHDDVLKYEIQRELKEININLWNLHETDKETDKVLKAFGEELLKLNLMAFYDRYKHIKEIEQEIKEAIKEYKYEDTPLKDRNKFQVLKSIHCFLYQCSEGNIPESNLFKVIQKIGEHIQSNIINNIPEYEKAVWN